MHTLRTFSLALAIFSWRERLRTDRLWWRFSVRPSWRPPDVELPSLPSLRPEAASDRQLKKKVLREKHIKHIFCMLIKKRVSSYLSTGGGARAVDPEGCSTGVDWGALTGAWNRGDFHKSRTWSQKHILTWKYVVLVFFVDSAMIYVFLN